MKRITGEIPIFQETLELLQRHLAVLTRGAATNFPGRKCPVSKSAEQALAHTSHDSANVSTHNYRIWAAIAVIVYFARKKLRSDVIVPGTGHLFYPTERCHQQRWREM